MRHPQQVADGREQVHHLGKLAPLGAGMGGARQADHQRHPDRRLVQVAHLASHAVLAELVAMIGHQVAILLRRSLEHAGDQFGVLQVAVVVESHGGHLVVGDRPEAAVGAVRLAERHAVEAVRGEMVAEVALAGRQAVGVVQHAELVRVAPGDHRGARRHAHRVVGKAVAERHRFGAQRVDVRGAHERILVVVQHVLARLVGHDQHQVGHRRLPRLSYPCRRRECRLRVGWLAARHGRRVPHWRTA